MMENFERMNLYLFDGGMASGAGAGMAGAGASATGGENTGMDAASQRAEDTTADAGQETQQRDLRSEWNRMINGEFKDLAHEHTQKIIDRRFKETKTLQEKDQRWQELGRAVAARYGMDTVDAAELIKAINNDRGFLQEQADAHGMTNEQYKNFSDYNVEKKAIRAKEEMTARWRDEANALSAKDPSFKLESALKDRRFTDMVVEGYTMQSAHDVCTFAKNNPHIDMDHELEQPGMVGMLRSGVPMQVAYNALHHDELMQNGMQLAAQQTQKQVTDTIQARGMRPKEGAAKGNGGIVKRLTARDLTPKELNDYNARLMAGQNPQYEDYVKRR